MDDRRREDITSAAQKQGELANDAAQSMIRLWQSRIDMALAIDDEDVLREALKGPGGEAGIWDSNTNCSGCGGGTTAHWA
jgi:hypothetical protein